MRIPDISSIDLSEKYQKLYDRFVEQADAPVEVLESEKESNTDEKSLMQNLMSDVRAARLEYVKIKRNSIFGTLQSGDKDYLSSIVTRIKENLTEAVKQMSSSEGCSGISNLKVSTRCSADTVESHPTPDSTA